MTDPYDDAELERDAQGRRSLFVTFGVFLAVCLAIAVGAALLRPRPAREPQPPSASATAPEAPDDAVGMRGRLYFHGATPLAVAASQDVLEDFLSAVRAHDKARMERLLLSGLVIPLRSGTRVRVINAGWRYSKIGVMEGAYAGEVGWVPAEWTHE